MAEQNVPLLPHLKLIDRSITQQYTPRPGRGRALALPTRNRQQHGSTLLESLYSFLPVFNQRKVARNKFYLDVPQGITIEFRSAPGFDLAFESLDLTRSGIELLNVRFHDDMYLATCYVPENKLAILVKKVTAYINENTKTEKPKNATLIESIESIGLATINALWTDNEPIPDASGEYWWEVWVRTGSIPLPDAFNKFRLEAEKLGIHVAQQRLDFPERIVTTVRSTLEQLVVAIDLLNLIAEIRNIDKKQIIHEEMKISNQDTFLDHLVNRLTYNETNVSVAVFDTGIARSHPLISGVLNQVDMHAVEQAWGLADHHGHGTQMAGIAVYGDIRNIVSGNQPIEINYKLESYKVISPMSTNNDEESFGAITKEAVYRCEVQAPNRRRVICKAVTSVKNLNGEPSSYSGAIDQLAFAEDFDEKRLFIISAGNTPDNFWLNFPVGNQTYGIEQPGQAWNALTVGCYTEKQHLPPTQSFDGWSVLADHGDLSPFSATSYTWDSNWPIKPEVLFEGGNVAVDPSGTQCQLPTTLQLLTTEKNFTVKPFSYINMTSAATALASRLAARVYANYQYIWPETTRGLFVHFADWTEAQKSNYLEDNSSSSYRRLLKTCGWGVPNEVSVLNSIKNRVCMIAEESIQPYKIESSSGKMNEILIFELPWPQDLLLALAEKIVKLRVTLSYFIEPSPERRGWTNKYRYASHGLRFDLRRATESETEFNKRVNHAMRDEGEQLDSPDDSGWVLGDKLRRLGSIHSDRWSGMASDLVARDRIAIYPVVGWWRQKLNRDRCETNTRFSLIVSLEAPDLDIDLYTEIKHQLEIPITLQPVTIIEQENEL